MTEEQLQAIKERAERVDPNRYDANNIFHSQLDVPALIAEVERLRELVNEIAGDVAEHTAKSDPAPLAVIFWREPGKDEASYKTICYDEQDVITMCKRHTTDGDFYNKLVPSVQMVNGKEPMQQVA